MLTFGSLFAGIGGLDLGLERAGMECKWQVEIDEHCRKVLAKHWPDVRRHDDVKTFPPDDGQDWSVDLIAGGFPCQDISYAGKGAGIEGERSGLFFELARIVRALGPRFVLLENVPALFTRGIDRVLGTLASLGYDAEWEVLPACAFGAPHVRERVFILAYAQCRTVRMQGRGKAERETTGMQGSAQEREWVWPNAGSIRGDVSDTNSSGCKEQWRTVTAQEEQQAIECGNWWSAEPDVGRVADGIPSRVDRIRGLGNAVVPQVAEWVGQRILEIERSTHHA